MSRRRLKELALVYTLSEIKGLGPVKLKTLLDRFPDIEEIQHTSIEKLTRVKGISKSLVKKIVEENKDIESSIHFVENQIRISKDVGGNIISLCDELYPRNLLNSPACHGLVYVMGDIGKLEDLNKKTIAIVGTRKASRNGLEKSYEFGSSLAKEGFTIVSGLADGIDSKAHLGCLDSGGLTIAVLGSGPDVVYPKSSNLIYHKILKNGLILSEFPFGEPINQLNLMKRNKTIVGLSNWIIVVETGKRGGTFNSVRAARDQNKRIFVDIPKDPSLESVQGNFDLIRSIVPVNNHSQIIDEIKRERDYDQETLL